MSEVTEADRLKAAELVDTAGQRHEFTPALVAAIAAALAEEREKARAPFLALADDLDGEAGSRWVRVLQARGTGERDAEFGERGAGDALHDAALRIRHAAEETA